MGRAEVTKLWEERKTIWSRMMEIGQAPESEERDNNFKTASDDLTKLDEKIEKELTALENESKINTRSLELAERMAKLGESLIDPSVILGGAGGLPGNPGEQRNKNGKFEFRGKEFATKEEIVDEANMIAFRSWIKGGERGLLALPQEVRAMVASDFSSGGAITAPKQFMDQLLKDVDSLTIFKGKVETTYIDKAESLGWPTLDGDFTDYTKLGENETAPEDNLTFGQRELKPQRFGKRVKLSRELLIRSVQPVESLVRERLAVALARTQEKKIILGTGANEPLGFMTPSNQGVPTSQDVTAAAAGAVDFDTPMDAIQKLPEAYRPGAEFYFNSTVVTKYRKLKATDNNYLWQDSISAGAPATLHGYPVRTSDYMPGTVATGLYTGAFANLKLGYIFADAWENFFKRAEELYLETNQIGFFSHVYFDGMPKLAKAIARIKQP